MDSVATVQGSYVYLYGGRGFAIVDTSNPRTPTLVGAYDAQASDGVIMGDMVVSSGSVFLSSPEYGGGVRIFDVSDPESRSLAATWEPSNFGDSLLRLAINSGHLWVLAHDAPRQEYDEDCSLWLYVYDIGDPTEPRLAGQCQVTSNSLAFTYGLVMGWSRAFVGIESMRVSAIHRASYLLDVSNPNNPLVLESIVTGEDFGLAMSEDFAIHGWKIFDSGKSGPMKWLGSSECGPTDGAAIGGDYVYWVGVTEQAPGAGGLRIYRITQLPLPPLNQITDIPDLGLLVAIRAALNKPTGDLAVADMESLSELDASRQTRGPGAPLIQSLQGPQAARNLTRLDLSGLGGPDAVPNLALNDLSPLAGLGSLTELELANNGLTRLTLPEGLTHLRYLNVLGNPISYLAVPKSMDLSQLVLEGFPIEQVTILLRIGPAMVEADGKIRLPIEGACGQRVKLQRSENLVDWEDRQTMTLGGDGCGIIDTPSGSGHCFYRVVEDKPKPGDER